MGSGIIPGAERDALHLDEEAFAAGAEERQVMLDVGKIEFILTVLQLPPGISDLSTLECLRIQERPLADSFALAAEEYVMAQALSR